MHQTEVSQNYSDTPIPPSDIGQARTRVLIVTLLSIWTYFQLNAGKLDTSKIQTELQAPLVYLAISILILALLVADGRATTSTAQKTILIRKFCVLTDVFAISIYTAVSHQLALIVLPVYLTYVIGNGFRFGVRYFGVAMFLSIIGFSIAHQHNSFLVSHRSIVSSYYLSLVFVPLYALLLLLKYRSVVEDLSRVSRDLDTYIRTMSHEFRRSEESGVGKE